MIEYLLHIGTSRLTCLKTRVDRHGHKNIEEIKTRSADGFDKGIVKDLGKASETLRSIFHEMDNANKETIYPIKTILSHHSLKNFIYGSSIYFHGTPRPITMKDVREVIAQTRSVATIPLDQIIVQAVPQEFIVNDMSGIYNPIGLEATRLGVMLRLFTMDYSVCNNLIRAMERVDIESREFIPASLAAGQAVLTPEEKEEGVILVDIGGYVTRLDFYKDSILVKTVTLEKGSEDITQAIAKQVGLRPDHARQLKEKFGTAALDADFQEELIPITTATNGEKRHIARKQLEAELKEPVEQLLSSITHAIQEMTNTTSPIGHVVFTGGGAKLDGLLDQMQERISYSLRLGVPKSKFQIPPSLQDTAYSCVIGALDYSSLILDPLENNAAGDSVLARAVDSAKRWVAEYF
ncbi:MAG: cell division protein FtsA [Candidatus Omnitrophica bacterium CG11_big_fil_rev_8_21_14_0_20_45_26]|uniref:Cell division protein FtsA n=1 Tax=Candidatus Abzuiibacterium crystallinum TaxID=1974748 RepID=A0A2H0LPD5_9BACT|nr:MAG: cell division protein FtsA [Candidatus Omnitrophica bacterium CG11_big_fil_rev_8_21_14_0_20_45_26]PIW64314.1 MAG: cell division protein FtsA [Candidatus Omnitrophica bacterium CG12_big_fil_rev_8_21_14_0_65_45_16]